MCRRAATVGFTNDSLGLQPGFEAQRQACLDLINRGQVGDGIAIPLAILDAPFPSEQKLRYFIDDGTVLNYNPGPFLVWDCTDQNDGAYLTLQLFATRSQRGGRIRQ